MKKLSKKIENEWRTTQIFTTQFELWVDKLRFSISFVRRFSSHFTYGSESDIRIYNPILKLQITASSYNINDCMVFKKPAIEDVKKMIVHL